MGHRRRRPDRRSPPRRGRLRRPHDRLHYEDPRGLLRTHSPRPDRDPGDQRPPGRRQPDPLPRLRGRPPPGGGHQRRHRRVGPRRAPNARQRHGRRPRPARRHFRDPELEGHPLRRCLPPVLLGCPGGRQLRGPRRPHGDRRRAHLRRRERLLRGRPRPRRPGLRLGTDLRGSERQPRRGRGTPRGRLPPRLRLLRADGGAAAADARPLGQHARRPILPLRRARGRRPHHLRGRHLDHHVHPDLGGHPHRRPVPRGSCSGLSSNDKISANTLVGVLKASYSGQGTGADTMRLLPWAGLVGTLSQLHGTRRRPPATFRQRRAPSKKSPPCRAPSSPRAAASSSSRSATTRSPTAPTPRAAAWTPSRKAWPG